MHYVIYEERARELRVILFRCFIPLVLLATAEGTLADDAEISPWAAPSKIDSKILADDVKDFGFGNSPRYAPSVRVDELKLGSEQEITCFSCINSSTVPDLVDSEVRNAETHVIDGTYILMRNPTSSDIDFYSAIKKYNLNATSIESSDLYIATEEVPDLRRIDLPRYMIERSIQFTEDPSILAASPDTFTPAEGHLKSDRASEASLALSTTLPIATDPNQSSYDDMQLSALWEHIPTDYAFTIGIFDQGFSRHEDIDFAGLPHPPAEAADHGNHVAGLACAKHNNGIGIRGVLPNCTVAVHNPRFSPGTATNENERFVQQIANLQKMITEHSDVKTFSVSLGNSIPREIFAEPSSAAAAQFKSTIKLQANFVIVLLRLAEENEQTIFFAAGNDSNEFTSVPAAYGSPFNYASIWMQPQQQGAPVSSGIVVQAHDTTGKRWERSNDGAHISCPGVGLYSAVSRDRSGNKSEASYERDSGTSMATPLCAAAFEGLRRLKKPNDLNTFRMCVFDRGPTVARSAVRQMKIKLALEDCE